MATIFTRFISGEIHCHKIAESENYFAFLDDNPVAKGHTLVIPKNEVDYIFDLDNEAYSGLMDFSKQIASAIEKSVSCIRIGLLAAGTSVPHAHVHLIPLLSETIDFERKINMDKSEMENIASEIRRNLISTDK